MSRLEDIYRRVTEWQHRTFPNQTAESILAHMRLELKEIEAAPHDIEERADMAILAMGVFDRLGAPPHLEYGESFESSERGWAWGKCHSATTAYILGVFIQERSSKFLAIRHILVSCTFGISSLDTEDKFLDAIEAKFAKNLTRDWPAPEDQVPGEPVEHIREPVCATCNDSRRMSLGEREVLCTRCPRPCENCRSGGYCRVPRCACKCHMPVEHIR